MKKKQVEALLCLFCAGLTVFFGYNCLPDRVHQEVEDKLVKKVEEL